MALIHEKMYQKDNLADYFRTQTRIGGYDGVPIAADIRIEQIEAAIQNTYDGQTGKTVEAFTLTAPTNTVAVTTGEVAVLGTVTFIS